MADLRDAPTLNALWAGLLVEELVRQGVGLFCLAPGSRSTPLALAVAEHPAARHLMHFDERGTAFAALGYARATGKPAVWITTSGTAVANGLPAVVEADEDGVPLLLLTADRPPELRDTAANQTIRQPEIFAPYARHRADLSVPTAAVDPAYVLTTAAQAVARALGPPAGPVHLNAPFREPLVPVPDGSVPSDYLHRLERWLEGDAPYTRYVHSLPSPSAEEAEGVWRALRQHERGLVVAGRLGTREQAEAAAQVGRALGWPVVLDVGSQGRLGMASGGIAHVDLILSSESFCDTHRPDAVLHLGGRALSKRLGQFLAASRPAAYAVARPDLRRFDPDHLVTHRLQAHPVALAAAWAPTDFAAPASVWAGAWEQADAAVGQALRQSLDAESAPLSEPRLARLVTRSISAGGGLVLAASMPVRDVDLFGATDGPRVPVATNRGASGIDGTVATAAGFARGLGGPVTLLIGDLALLHDLNSLALLRQPGQPQVTVVVVNNDGGGIFHFLPIAQHERFETLFGTPHGLGFESAARMFGLAYAAPKSAREFQEAFREAQTAGAPAILEVRTDREQNRALHALLRRAAAEAIAPPPSMTDPLPHLRWGDPERPPLVLLHGFLGHAADWSEIAPRFASDFDVWALDLPGHGGAHERTETESSVGAAAEAVMATMKARGVDRFALVGYSMGGRIALYLAAHHPERLQRLVLVGASPGLRSRQTRAARQTHDRSLAARLDACTNSDDVRRFLDRWYAAPLWASTPDALVARWTERRQHGDPEGWARALRAGGTGRMAPLWDLLPGLRVPTLALHGTRDAKFAALADDMAESAGAVRPFAIPNAGHAAHAEQPDRFTDAALPFLRPSTS